MLSLTYHSFLISLLSLSVGFASPFPSGVKFETRSALPILILPYASYKAASYRASTDIYVFKNIRYAAPPVGNLRWAKPAPPETNSTLQDGSYGPKCIQSAVSGLNLVGDGNSSPVGAAINQFLGGLPIPLFEGGSEDCLFLDVYVPGKALKNPSLKLPVAVWIYGGAYLLGSKDPFYDGSGIMGQASNDMIFVAMNYRMGAYGFLAGTTMEKEGLPNAGLWDQRAALQWVRDYIGLVGGDPTRVTAMGESAGAGSIMHHLAAEGGKLDPLFSKAILQSPAFQMMWDRSGGVQGTFEDFATFAGCQGKGLACLRSASGETLLAANKALHAKQTPGTFAVGPTPDGSFIRQLPLLEYAAGSFWPVESLILSHVADESSVFVSGAIQTDSQFSGFLEKVFPNYTIAAGVNAKVEAFYPPPAKKKSIYSTQTARVSALLRDSSFTCNVRYLTEALGPPKVWNMQYSVFPGKHGTDLIPTFFSTSLAPSSSGTWLENLALLMVPVVAPLVSGISAGMQSYFASYVTTGNPNTHRKIWNVPPTVAWNHPTTSVTDEKIGGVVNVGDWGFGTISDDQNMKTPCDFWRGFASVVTQLGGYVPEGEEDGGDGNGAGVWQGFVAKGEREKRNLDGRWLKSRNYKGGNLG
ncbi:Alpha/Beta hydrolase protein [Apodospora peruviana]|uniref:Alpha/Beta hydrolase protein n=1 Tax=Apodospora peruviana TaxID=516989 RepID=A0AAE0M225_9PEZI|nr:Alpha/Beta hydrolase protein [Apodospora peruviana]